MFDTVELHPAGIARGEYGTADTRESYPRVAAVSGPSRTVLLPIEWGTFDAGPRTSPVRTMARVEAYFTGKCYSSPETISRSSWNSEALRSSANLRRLATYIRNGSGRSSIYPLRENVMDWNGVAPDRRVARCTSSTSVPIVGLGL